ncbi:Hypothetical protein DEACI_1080 [Acididesulfobacillus acetoxydans]|uniref:YeeE/YedE family protein n=1 Tax=Acididesulfobacillus acetoxydans TaxID=1561005 RepID=A0A8S0XVK9_9FIRM|nr:Hypothetical protein DEACI_1080 [Acididesulfobacillus acetoxydans]CEJ06561.1 Hypothetical protein DEACI_1010 [Acididesulfobacillus acetoxydans]
MITGCGQGNLDYLIPGLLGFLTGGVLFGETYQSFFLKISTYASYGQKTLGELLGVNHWLLIFIVVGGTLIFYLASKISESKQRRTVTVKEQQAAGSGQVRESGTSA